MKRMAILLVLFCSTSTTVSADIIQQWECYINEGKTRTDVLALVEKQKAWEAKNKLKYVRTGVMWPLYGNNDRQPGFFIYYHVVENYAEFGKGLNTLWEGKDAIGPSSPFVSENNAFACNGPIRLYTEM